MTLPGNNASAVRCAETSSQTLNWQQRFKYNMTYTKISKSFMKNKLQPNSSQEHIQCICYKANTYKANQNYQLLYALTSSC